MQPFTVSALLGAAALAKAEITGFHFLNRTIPENVPVGTDIGLDWTATTGYTGEFVLQVLAFNINPIGYQPGPFGSIPLYDTKKEILSDTVVAAGGSYVWTAAAVADGWTGSQYLYQIDAVFPDQSSGSAGAFYLA